MMPHLSAPIIRPQFFETALQQVVIGTDPETGEDVFVWDEIHGAEANPNDPQRWLPVGCQDWCFVVVPRFRAPCVSWCSR